MRRPASGANAFLKYSKRCRSAHPGAKSHGLGPPLADKTTIGFPHLGAEECVIDPPLRRVNVEIGWHDVVIASEDHRLTGCEQAPRMIRKPVEPAQLVIELGAGRGIAIRELKAPDDHSVDRRFDIPAVDIVGIAGQAQADFYGLNARARTARPFQLF